MSGSSLPGEDDKPPAPVPAPAVVPVPLIPTPVAPTHVAPAPVAPAPVPAAAPVTLPKSVAATVKPPSPLPGVPESVLTEVVEAIVEDVIRAKKSKPSLASVVLESITEMIQSYSMEPTGDEIQEQQLDMIAEEDVGEDARKRQGGSASVDMSKDNSVRSSVRDDRKRKTIDEEDTTSISQKPVSLSLIDLRLKYSIF